MHDPQPERPTGLGSCICQRDSLDEIELLLEGPLIFGVVDLQREVCVIAGK